MKHHPEQERESRSRVVPDESVGSTVLAELPVDLILDGVGEAASAASETIGEIAGSVFESLS
jgi:hypothetical protein